jgi:transposase
MLGGRSHRRTGPSRLQRSPTRVLAQTCLLERSSRRHTPTVDGRRSRRRLKRLAELSAGALIRPYTVAAGLVAAIGDIRRFSSPQKLVSYFGLNPRVRQSGLGFAQHGRISKIGRAHARALLVEAAWAAAKAPGPLHAFFVRIRGRRGHQIAAVATARKMAVLVWHLLAKEADYLWARPSLVAHKLRTGELQAGRPTKKGNRRGPAYAYNVKALRNREMAIAEQAERAYEHFVGQWRQKPPTLRPRAAPVTGSS